jgi:glycosyltransferase involved in cell wall biosynthesis
MIPPTVSCLMVSRDRVEMAKVAIAFYERQDYPKRNLVIVSDSPDETFEPLAEHVRLLGRRDVKLVRVPVNIHSLGALRNISIAHANGDLICQWDDDDYYHPRRLTLQVTYMLNEKCNACFLTEQLQFVPDTRSLYWCDWENARIRNELPAAIPNTMLCERASTQPYPENGEYSARSEDVWFMQNLTKSCRVALLRNAAVLYVYVSHGKNTWDMRHHMGLVQVAGLGTVELLRRRRTLMSAMRYYPMKLPVVVRDYAGQPAYTISELN